MINFMASSVKSILSADTLIKISNVELLKPFRSHDFILFKLLIVRSASFDPIPNVAKVWNNFYYFSHCSLPCCARRRVIDVMDVILPTIVRNANTSSFNR